MRQARQTAGARYERTLFAVALQAVVRGHIPPALYATKLRTSDMVDKLGLSVL